MPNKYTNRNWRFYLFSFWNPFWELFRCIIVKMLDCHERDDKVNSSQPDSSCRNIIERYPSGTHSFFFVLPSSLQFLSYAVLKTGPCTRVILLPLHSTLMRVFRRTNKCPTCRYSLKLEMVTAVCLSVCRFIYLRRVTTESAFVVCRLRPFN